MTKYKDHLHLQEATRRFAGPVLVALLVANAFVLSAEEKDKDKNKGKKAEAVQKAPAPSKPAEAPAGKGGAPGGERQAPALPGARPMPGQPSQPAGRPAPGQPVQPAQPVGRQAPVQPAQPFGRPAPFQPAAPGARPGAPAGVNPGLAHPSAPFGHAPMPAAGRVGPPPQITRGANGTEIHRAPDGRLREVHTAGGGVILHSPSGVRRVELERPGGGRVVAIGHGGSVQRPMMFHGQSFVQRTYVVNGIVIPRVFRPWSFGGREFSIYTPMHFYRPAFYSWAYSPWRRPVSYGWGWENRPWFGFYGGYFAPYPTYASPLFWLSDFVLSTTLEAAYLSHVGAPPVYYGAAPMSPEARQAIADEVQRTMNQERADQAQAASYGQGSVAPPPAIFSPNGPRTFLVAGEVSGYAGNQEVPLSEGAVLQLTATPSPSSEYAEVAVLASRNPACPTGSFLYVKTTDLQEMQNHMQATIDQGLDRLQSGKGLAGIPTPPPQAAGTVNAPFANEVAPDESALNALDAAIKEADQSEQGLQTQAQAPAPAPSITLGMPIYQVENLLGAPKSKADLGSKKIYFYPGMKVTFTNGRVSDVN